MPRPVNQSSQYTVKPHTVGAHTYASTQPWEIDQATGKKKYHYVHWGTVSNMAFFPGARYVAASPEERGRLIFPPAWNLSECDGLSGKAGRGRHGYDGAAQNRLYGHAWLLEQVADCTGLRQDLENVFDGNKEMVSIVLTLAFFPYLTKFTYNRLERWQRTDWSPYPKPLNPGKITLFTQSITESHRMSLIKLRCQRIGKDALCAVDSTSRSAYGDALADTFWGRNKERLPLQQTTEVVVYTLSQHMPVYYRTFPGNMNDSRSYRTILGDLERAGLSDVVFITDRGYESIRNIEEFILRGQKAAMCIKTCQALVKEKIDAFGEFSVHPTGMEIDTEARLYMSQYKIDYKVKGNGDCVKEADDMKVSLFFDPVRRSGETVDIDIACKGQGECLEALRVDGRPPENQAALKKEMCYYSLDIDKETCVLKGFELNVAKIRQSRMLAGFFAIVTLGLPWDANTTFANYKLRDEQEKYFEQMKDQMVADRQRNWSEDGKTGRLFILFVSLVIGSYVRHIWKTTGLSKKFSSSMDILDEMRSIRCIEHPQRAKFITPFICEFSHFF